MAGGRAMTAETTPFMAFVRGLSSAQASAEYDSDRKRLAKMAHSRKWRSFPLNVRSIERPSVILHLSPSSLLFTSPTMTTHNPNHCLFAVPKKGRLYEKVNTMLQGAGIEYHREPRLDIAICKDLDMTIVFLPAADISKYVGMGNVDIGVTGIDIVEESESDVVRVMDLGFGKCKLCVQTPISSNVTDVKTLAGKRIVTSFPTLAKKFFDPIDVEMGVSTSIIFINGSVEAACGLGLADAIVDLVETGTTMKAAGLEIVETLF